MPGEPGFVSPFPVAFPNGPLLRTYCRLVDSRGAGRASAFCLMHAAHSMIDPGPQLLQFFTPTDKDRPEFKDGKHETNSDARPIQPRRTRRHAEECGAGRRSRLQ